MSFAHLKRLHGLRGLRLRGPTGAHDEFPLAATTQNLKRFVRYGAVTTPYEKIAV